MISIHAPREGCDSSTPGQAITWLEFQSTHPVRGATDAHLGQNPQHGISIHAPREGCDLAAWHSGGMGNGISIHAPREGCDIPMMM